MASSVTEVLNIWNEMGVFSYVIPFLLIFAVVFAILKKSKILGDDNDSILAIISIALGLLSLQFDFVSRFYAIVFPKFGIGLSLFLVLVIMVGFFYPVGDISGMKWIGYVIGIGVVLWTLSSWNEFGEFGFGSWFNDNFWALIIVGVVIAAVSMVVRSGKNKLLPPRHHGGGHH